MFDEYDELISCPYCYEDQLPSDYRLDIDDNVFYVKNCEKCNKNFEYKSKKIFTYEMRRLTCLNGGDHDYRLGEIDNKRAWKCEFCQDTIIRDCLGCDIVFPEDSNVECKKCNNIIHTLWGVTSFNGHGHIGYPQCDCQIEIVFTGGVWDEVEAVN